MNNAITIQDLKSKGWNYLGSCACSEPADKFSKGSHTLKLSRRRDRWNLIRTSNSVIENFGEKENLFERIKDI